MVGRQGRDAEDGDPLGQIRPTGKGPLQARKGFFPAHRPVRSRAFGCEQPPEGCLPVTIFARFPPEHHVGPVNEILIVEARDDPGELVALEAAAVVSKVRLQGLEPFAVQANGQQAHDPPGEHLRIEGGRPGQIGQNVAENPLDEMVGKGEADVGADPHAPRQLQGEPPFHAVALDQDDLRGHGFGERRAEGLRKLSRRGLRGGCW